MLRAVGTTTEPLVRRLTLVYLYVSEMELSLEFYRDLLGIPLEGDGEWQEASLGETRFALHLAHEGIELALVGLDPRESRGRRPHALHGAPPCGRGRGGRDDA